MFERKKPSGKLLSLPIDQIHPSPFQARKSFDEQELTALAQSIRENGLLQPVTVRRVTPMTAPLHWVCWKTSSAPT